MDRHPQTVTDKDSDAVSDSEMLFQKQKPETEAEAEATNRRLIRCVAWDATFAVYMVTWSSLRSTPLCSICFPAFALFASSVEFLDSSCIHEACVHEYVNVMICSLYFVSAELHKY
ncbi:hypothetical protein ACLKA7_016343 [Drosophila subpalustris]